jgi:uncharacterized protein (TIGR00369 family)
MDDFPDLERFRDLCENRIPFNRLLGVRLETMASGSCRLVLPFREELLGDVRRGACHGGVLSMLIDTCGGFAVWSMAGLEARLATIDMRVDYLQPATGTDLCAEGRVRLLGNRVGNAQVTLTPVGRPDEILAEGRGVYNIRKD